MIGPFGNYEILRELGRGGMGVVYKAHEVMLNRAVALKVLPAHFASNPGFVDRFHREARAVAQLNHPNVVTIFNIGEHEGHHFIAMEFVKGESLADLLRRETKLELGRALEIMRQVAAALDEAHRFGIIHRDIKPHNIMLDEAGRAKVMDFGIARIMTEDGGGLTGTGETLGTPAYMSPEQCRGLDLDGRSDVYAAGVVLFETLTGRRPFQGNTPIASIEKVLFEPPPILSDDLPDAPAQIVALVGRCLAKNREERFPTAAHLEFEIREFLYPGAATAPREIFESASFQAHASLSAGAAFPSSGSVTAIKADPGLDVGSGNGAGVGAAAGMAPPPRGDSTPGGDFPPWDDGPGDGFDEAPTARIAAAAARRKLARVGAGILAASALLMIGAVAMVWRRSAREDAGGAGANAGAANATAIGNAARATTPAASPLEWAEAPAPGSDVWDERVHLAWRATAGADVGGFQLALNDAPLIETTDTSHTFELTQPGPHRVLIQPIGPVGATGAGAGAGNPAGAKAAPLVLEFNYAPNKPPTLVASLAREIVPVGAPVEVNVQASDPEGRPVRIEARVDGAAWIATQSGRQPLPGLAEGERRVEVRAVDEPGRPSEIWSATARVLAPAELLDRGVKAYTGTGGKIDEPAARDLIEAAAGAGDPVGRMWLAWMNYWGRAGFAQDQAKAAEIAAAALPEALKLAEGDDSDAQFLAGAALDLGMGAQRDSAKGAPLLLKAAEAGHSQAMTYLGWVELTGRNGKPNEKAAAEWFRKAAELGDAQAMNNLGNLLARGTGVKKDETRAAEWFKRGADLGSASNMNSLGAMYMEGRGVKQDEKKGLETLRLAARLGNKTAQTNLEKLKLTW